MNNLHLWRVLGLGQVCPTYVLSQAARVGEVEAALDWWDENKRPIETLAYLGQVCLTVSARAVILQTRSGNVESVTDTDRASQEPKG